MARLLLSDGHNIISDNSCTPNPGLVGDLHGTDPLLGPRPTSCHWPAARAIDYGVACPAVDIRGTARPVGPACDVGAVEFGGTVSTGFVVYVPLNMG